MKTPTNMLEVRQRNVHAGNCWFSPDTLRFFRSRIGDELFGGRYFISSEKGLSGVRAYSVREAIDGGVKINTVGEFQEHGSWNAARRAITALLEA